MASSNCVADVTGFVTKALKAKDSTVQTPAKWAAAAGFSGSAASPLRAHIARASDNGCGRTGRYPAVDAAGMLDLIELGHQYKTSEGAKQSALQKRIGSKLRPAAVKGAKQAKATAKRSSVAGPKRKAKATA